jgi:hypothetical protein
MVEKGLAMTCSSPTARCEISRFANSIGIGIMRYRGRARCITRARYAPFETVRALQTAVICQAFSLIKLVPVEIFTRCYDAAA